LPFRGILIAIREQQMEQIGTTLSYRMPETEFTVSVTRRMMVQRQETGSRLAPVVDVELSHAAGSVAQIA